MAGCDIEKINVEFSTFLPTTLVPYFFSAQKVFLTR